MTETFRLEVSLSQQTVTLFCGAKIAKTFSVSTAKNGPGEHSGSECTPRGPHYIRAKIGVDLPIGSVLVGRRPTSEKYSQSLALNFPQRDWILSRILWLCGESVGLNRLGDVDSMRRFIYIHGTPDTEPMGLPLSHGCIRMRNDDIVWLFDQISVGTKVLIKE